MPFLSFELPGGRPLEFHACILFAGLIWLRNVDTDLHIYGDDLKDTVISSVSVKLYVDHLFVACQGALF